MHLATVVVCPQDILQLTDYLGGGHGPVSMGRVADQYVRGHVMLLNVSLSINRHNLEGKPRLEVRTFGILVYGKGG